MTAEYPVREGWGGQDDYLLVFESLAIPAAYRRGAVSSGCLEAGEGDRTGDIQLGKRNVPSRNRVLRVSMYEGAAYANCASVARRCVVRA
jgi:hypothetical protein